MSPVPTGTRTGMHLPQDRDGKRAEAHPSRRISRASAGYPCGRPQGVTQGRCIRSAPCADAARSRIPAGGDTLEEGAASHSAAHDDRRTYMARESGAKIPSQPCTGPASGIFGFNRRTFKCPTAPKRHRSVSLVNNHPRNGRRGECCSAARDMLGNIRLLAFRQNLRL